jgi:hypothetical protein
VTDDCPCFACGKGDWCRISPDGSHVACHRVPEGAYRTETYKKNHQPYYLHRLKEGATPRRPPATPTAPASGPGSARADDDALHRMYSRLHSMLLLGDRHRRELMARGLTDEAIRHHGLASWQRAWQRKAELLRRMFEDFSAEQLLGLPGVYRDDSGRLKLAGGDGLVMPVRDHQGRLVALLIRPDEQIPGTKYYSLSSKKRGGPSSGSRVHVPPFAGDTSTARITEGALKSTVATALSGVLTIGLPGPYGDCLPALKALGVRRVLLAFDMDKATNEHVQRGEAECLRALLAAGYEVEVEEWDVAKGIDDALKAGAEIRKRTVRADDVAPDQPGPGKPADRNHAQEPPPWTAAGIILAHFRGHYRPDFKRGNAIHCADGREVRQNEACAAAPWPLIEKLAAADNAPRFKGDAVNREALPALFKRWAPTAWANLLGSLCEEDDPAAPTNEVAAEEFRRLLRSVFLSEFTLARTIRKGRDVERETKIENRSLIGWCSLFAKDGRWQSIRSKQCWCRLEVDSDGVEVLKVAFRHGLLCQMRAAPRLAGMHAERFARLARKHGAVTSGRDVERVCGQRVLHYDQAEVNDLIRTVPEEPEVDTAPSGETEAEDGVNFEDAKNDS